MDLNLGTTISFCAAATSSSIGVLGVYLSRRAASRHFRYAATAGFAGAFYCVTNAVLAGRVSPVVTVWAGRFGMLAMCVHAAAWLAFLAAWDRRQWSRRERTLIVVNLFAGLVALIPGAVAYDTFTERTVASLGITYRDPDVGPLGVPIVLLCYAVHVVAAVIARRMTASNPRARAVSIGLGVFCVIIPIDLLSGVHVLDLPYLADPALAFVLLCIGAVVVLDAAESAEKTAQLERARLALAERENLAALGQLAAVVAHEVRNPVGIIFAALATLQKESRSAEDTSLLGIVGEEANRLKHLVARLLEAVRPFELQYSRNAPRTLIETAVSQALSGAGAPTGQVELVSSFGAEDVECDDVMLVQAISNLVQNALEASGRRSPVQVRAAVDVTSPAPMLRVEIADDGEGVPPEVRSRLFTPFFTTRATGTGLGLALVKRIAAAHGGTVDYTPSDVGGACFVLCVPVRSSDATPRYLVGNDLR